MDTSVGTIDGFIGMKDVAEIMGVKTHVIFGMVKNKTIPHYRFGRSIKFKTSEITTFAENYIESCRVDVLPSTK